MDKVEFLAHFPSIQSAFKRHGGGNGLRTQLDIPEKYVEDAVQLMALTTCNLKVTVEVAESEDNGRKSYI
jgi:hypothetical protein